jgi:hypothetical protein
VDRSYEGKEEEACKRIGKKQGGIFLSAFPIEVVSRVQNIGTRVIFYHPIKILYHKNSSNRFRAHPWGTNLPPHYPGRIPSRPWYETSLLSSQPLRWNKAAAAFSCTSCRHSSLRRRLPPISQPWPDRFCRSKSPSLRSSCMVNGRDPSAPSAAFPSSCFTVADRGSS